MQECNTILLKIQREQQAEEEAKKNIEYDNILQVGADSGYDSCQLLKSHVASPEAVSCPCQAAVYWW